MSSRIKLPNINQHIYNITLTHEIFQMNNGSKLPDIPNTNDIAKAAHTFSNPWRPINTEKGEDCPCLNPPQTPVMIMEATHTSKGITGNPRRGGTMTALAIDPPSTPAIFLEAAHASKGITGNPHWRSLDDCHCHQASSKSQHPS